MGWIANAVLVSVSMVNPSVGFSGRILTDGSGAMFGNPGGFRREVKKRRDALAHRPFAIRFKVIDRQSDWVP